MCMNGISRIEVIPYEMFAVIRSSTRTAVSYSAPASPRDLSRCDPVPHLNNCVTMPAATGTRRATALDRRDVSFHPTCHAK